MQSAHRPILKCAANAVNQARAGRLPRARETEWRSARREVAGSQRQSAPQWGTRAATIPGRYIAREPTGRAKRRFPERSAKEREASRSYPTARAPVALQNHVSGARGEEIAVVGHAVHRFRRDERAKGSAGHFALEKIVVVAERCAFMRSSSRSRGRVVERRPAEECDPYFSFSVCLWH